MEFDYDVAIIGAGAAGLTAGIYAGRAGLKSAVFERVMAGGNTLMAPEIENYPSHIKIPGPDLMQLMKDQAQKWTTLREMDEIKDIVPHDEYLEVNADSGNLKVGAVIFATGARHRHLGVPGESKLNGAGVSYCATCDGSFFRGKKVAVVGGGNSAAVEALYLKGVGMDVHLIHRRDVLRAESACAERLETNGIKLHLETVIEGIKGDKKVCGLVLKNLRTGATSEEPFDACFVAIGLVPNSEVAKKAGVRCDDYGYIFVDGRMRTNVKRIYAAGDITSGGVKQIVVGCAQGATAALQSLEVLGRMYPF